VNKSSPRSGKSDFSLSNDPVAELLMSFHFNNEGKLLAPTDPVAILRKMMRNICMRKFFGTCDEFGLYSARYGASLLSPIFKDQLLLTKFVDMKCSSRHINSYTDSEEIP